MSRAAPLPRRAGAIAGIAYAVLAAIENLDVLEAPGLGAPVAEVVAAAAVGSTKLAIQASAGALSLVAYVLGAIGTDEAVAALSRLLASADWQDRGAAAKGLGFALKKNPAARAPLERAAADPDEFVRRKAEEGLEGRMMIEF